MDPTLRRLLRYRNPQRVRQLFLDNQRIPSIELLCLEPPSSSSDTSDTYAPLSRFENLAVLSLTGAHCRNLKHFPRLPALRRLALADNNLVGGLEHLVDKVAALEYLDLSNNKIVALESLQPLSQLSTLQHLCLIDCDVAQQDEYRQRVFSLLPSLLSLDGQDRDGKEVDSEGEEDEEDEDFMTNSEMDSDASGSGEEEEEEEEEDSEVEGAGEGGSDGEEESLDEEAICRLIAQRRQSLLMQRDVAAFATESAQHGYNDNGDDDDDEDDSDYVGSQDEKLSIASDSEPEYESRKDYDISDEDEDKDEPSSCQQSKSAADDAHKGEEIGSNMPSSTEKAMQDGEEADDDDDDEDVYEMIGDDDDDEEEEEEEDEEDEEGENHDTSIITTFTGLYAPADSELHGTTIEGDREDDTANKEASASAVLAGVDDSHYQDIRDDDDEEEMNEMDEEFDTEESEGGDSDGDGTEEGADEGPGLAYLLQDFSDAEGSEDDGGWSPTKRKLDASMAEDSGHLTTVPSSTTPSAACTTSMIDATTPHDGTWETTKKRRH